MVSGDVRQGYMVAMNVGPAASDGEVVRPVQQKAHISAF
jgi:hypothetical protein